MGRHEAVRKKFNLEAADGFFKKPFEGHVVAGPLKKNRTFGCSIECVEDQSSRALPLSACHDAAAEASSMPNGCRPSVL
jgi:hypothetical protein